MDARYIVHGTAILLLSLENHLPRPAEQIHVVDVVTAKRNLHRPEERTHVDPQCLYFLRPRSKFNLGDSAENVV